jgi:phosphoheptose isomerase
MKNDYLSNLILNYPDLASCAADIQSAYNLMHQSFTQGGKLLVCGNGGSAADAEHIVGEMMKGYILKRPVVAEVRNQLKAAFPEEGDMLADQLQGALPAISLVSHSALISAFANDVAPDMVFAQQVYGYGRRGDTLLAISTSGNSSNVVCAVKVACALGVHTIGLTGQTGGTLKGLCDVTICAPVDTTTAIQERHLPIYHAICAELEQAFFGTGVSE